MGKYTVKFSCGHEEVRELFGKESERERKIDYWEKSGICTDCYRAEQQKQATDVDATVLTMHYGTFCDLSWIQKPATTNYDPETKYIDEVLPLDKYTVIEMGVDFYNDDFSKNPYFLKFPNYVQGGKMVVVITGINREHIVNSPKASSYTVL